jgi:hypothetical protein
MLAIKHVCRVGDERHMLDEILLADDDRAENKTFTFMH